MSEDKNLIKNLEIKSYGNKLSQESIKVIAESIGISNLSDLAAKELADDISFKLKQIVQDGQKFMNHAKRQRLCLADVDQSLKIRNIEPQYGFVTKDFIPFRFASGGGRELHFQEEKELDLNDVLLAAPPKAPLEVSLRTHWLCVDGIQPTGKNNLDSSSIYFVKRRFRFQFPRIRRRCQRNCKHKTR
jgi:transcription initiation factor TFIID subunit 6